MENVYAYFASPFLASKSDRDPAREPDARVAQDQAEQGGENAVVDRLTGTLCRAKHGTTVGLICLYTPCLPYSTAEFRADVEGGSVRALLPASSVPSK